MRYTFFIPGVVTFSGLEEILAVVTYIADKTTLANRAKALGYQSAAISLGFIIGPGIGGFIAEFGIRAPFFFATAISLITAIFIFISILIDGYWTMIVITSIVFFSGDILFDINIDMPYVFAAIVLSIAFVISSRKLKKLNHN